MNKKKGYILLEIDLLLCLNGNTPTGTWDGVIDYTQVDEEVYEPYPRIRLTSISGNAYLAEHTYGRSGFLIHGGRASYTPPLYQTHGCIRVYDDDERVLVRLIEEDDGGHSTVFITES